MSRPHPALLRLAERLIIAGVATAAWPLRSEAGEQPRVDESLDDLHATA